MTIKWNLCDAMFRSGVFTVSDLRRCLIEKANYDISVPAIHRLVKSLPKECKLETLDALCQALDCEIGEIVLYEKPTSANKCIQPLVLDSTFKPPRKQKKGDKKPPLKIKMPPI